MHITIDGVSKNGYYSTAKLSVKGWLLASACREIDGVQQAHLNPPAVRVCKLLGWDSVCEGLRLAQDEGLQQVVHPRQRLLAHLH